MTDRSPVELANHPFSPERLELFNRALEGLSPTQLAFVSGYLAALAETRAGAGTASAAAVFPGRAAPSLALSATGPAPGTAAVAAPRPTVVYGSQTGNSKRVAEQLVASLREAGVEPRLMRTSEYPVREIAKERLLYLVISTQGDGDPPDDSRAFLDFIHGKRAPTLPQLEYSVLALGDSSYPQYCVTGRALDERLTKLGAKAVVARVDSDLDIEVHAAPWLRDTLAHARQAASRAGVATVTTLRSAGALTSARSYERHHPYEATVLANQPITSAGALKPVYHVELQLAAEGLDYEPGDALAVVPRNPEASVAALLAATHLDGDARVEHAGSTHTLAEHLATRAEITRIARPVLQSIADRSADARLRQLLGAEGRDELKRLTAQYQLADWMRAYPADWSPEALVATLRPLAHRSYSIASSRKLVGDEVHLTVAQVGGEDPRLPRWGAASTYLAQRAVDATVPVFIERNERFRLPADGARDVIMIGPGTGVAPFRAFVQERQAVGATGRNWLFYGGRHFAQDFLYQLEWQEALKRGALQRLDLAFSRDQSRKIYVQDRMREAAGDLYAWLANGASIYVCGDATHMAPDVHSALLEIVAAQGKLDAEAARAQVEGWMAEGRYLRDVY